MGCAQSSPTTESKPVDIKAESAPAAQSTDAATAVVPADAASPAAPVAEKKEEVVVQPAAAAEAAAAKPEEAKPEEAKKDAEAKPDLSAQGLRASDPALANVDFDKYMTPASEESVEKTRAAAEKLGHKAFVANTPAEVCFVTKLFVVSEWHLVIRGSILNAKSDINQ
jgi:hypothetical protein